MMPKNDFINRNFSIIFARFVVIFSVSALTLISTNNILIYSTRAEDQNEDAKKIQEDIDELNEKKDKIEDKLGDAEKKAKEINDTLKGLSGQLTVTKAQVNALNAKIDDLNSDIEDLNSKLALKQSELSQNLNLKKAAIRNLYIQEQQSSLVYLLAKNSNGSKLEQIVYHQKYVQNTANLISGINSNIKQYDSEKSQIENLKNQTLENKTKLSALTQKLAKDVSKYKNTLEEVSQSKVALEQERAKITKKLSELSEQQKGVLQEKTDTFTSSVGDVPSAGDPKSNASYDPGFKKAFAAFSFGAPHRKGLSQYGAKGRAESGQNYKDILKAYYGEVKTEKADVPKKVKTDKGEMDLDGKYLKGLAEMPSTWPMEALKAQAVAARTYALTYVGWRSGNGDGTPGGRICTTESCQVWSSSKSTSGSASRWHQAVEETKGVVMLSGEEDEVFSALYAASSGGYNYKYTSLGHTTRGGWDTKCSGKDCWVKDAYENIAGSPWFYKGWYKSRSGKACNHSHPWLTEKEFADIVGAIKLYKDNKDNQKHLSQLDAKTCYGKNVSDTWSMDDVKSKSGIEKVDEVKVTYNSGGETETVTVSTNKGDLKFSGEDFKAIFNLRAPSMIQIKSDLFNIEVKK